MSLFSPDQPLPVPSHHPGQASNAPVPVSIDYANKNSISLNVAITSKVVLHSCPDLENTKEVGLIVLYQLHILKESYKGYWSENETGITPTEMWK